MSEDWDDFFNFRFGNTWVHRPNDPRGRRSKNPMSWGTFCDYCDTVARGSSMNSTAKWRSYTMPASSDENDKDYPRKEEVEFCTRECLDRWLAEHPEA